MVGVSGAQLANGPVAAEDEDAVAEAARRLGWGTAGVVASPLPGPAGNVEFFLWLRRAAPPPREDDVRRAVQEGPS